jgi:hypothetical protein
MLRFVCENAIVLVIIALMTATIVPIGLALLTRAAWYAY